MKIMIITDCFFPSFGGIESHIHYLSSQLAKMGNKVYVITHLAKNDVSNEIIKDRYDNYSLIKIPGNVVYKFGADISLSYRSFKYLSQLIDEIKPDIIHGQSVLSFLVFQAMILAKRNDIPFVITKHSLIFRNHSLINSFLNNQFNPLSSLKRYVSGTFSVSGSVRNEIPFKTGKDIIIYNGIDKNEINPEVDPEMIRGELGINAENKIIGFVSRLIEKKGVYDFIELFSMLKKYKNIKGVIVGDGPERENMIKVIKKKGLTDQIILVGNKPHKNIGNYYQIFDLFFLPSKTEGLGIVLLEAMMFNVIPIAYNTGGIAEIVKNGETGFITSNVEDTCMLVMDILLKGKDVNEMREFIGNYAMGFTWEKIAANTEMVYRKILN